MSTASLIAFTPSRIWLISRSSGPRTAATMQNSLAPGGRGLLGGLHQLGDVQPHRAHRRGELPALAAEVAVLGAAAGLERDDALDLDLGPAPLHAYVVRELEQVGQQLVGRGEHGEDLLLAEPLAALEDLLAQVRQLARVVEGRLDVD